MFFYVKNIPGDIKKITDFMKISSQTFSNRSI